MLGLCRPLAGHLSLLECWIIQACSARWVLGACVLAGPFPSSAAATEPSHAPSTVDVFHSPVLSSPLLYLPVPILTKRSLREGVELIDFLLAGADLTWTDSHWKFFGYLIVGLTETLNREGACISKLRWHACNMKFTGWGWAFSCCWLTITTRIPHHPKQKLRAY